MWNGSVKHARLVKGSLSEPSVSRQWLVRVSMAAFAHGLASHRHRGAPVRLPLQPHAKIPPANMPVAPQLRRLRRRGWLVRGARANQIYQSKPIAPNSNPVNNLSPSAAVQYNGSSHADRPGADQYHRRRPRRQRRRILDAAREAAARGADLVVFPELSLTGYPPRDLVEKPSFLERSAVRAGTPRRARPPRSASPSSSATSAAPHASTGKRATNSAAVLERGQIVFRQTKMLLPTYDVFDEARYFVPAERETSSPSAARPIALTICEDAWNDKQFWERRLYRRDPVEELAQRRRAHPHQHQRLALPHGQARAAPRDLRRHRPPPPACPSST